MRVLIQERNGHEHIGSIPQESIAAARGQLDASQPFSVTPEEGEPFEVAAENIATISQLPDEPDEAEPETDEPAGEEPDASRLG